MWTYKGPVLSSKSLFNRALIVRSFEPRVQIQGSSDSDDVRGLQQALHDWTKGSTRLQVGHAGTTFRFLALRLSREVGEWRLDGSERLFARPQQGLIDLLNQLGMHTQLESNSLLLRSQGWRWKTPLNISTKESSQFLSALALSAWNLQQPLMVHLSAEFVSPAYWKMTRDLCEYFGAKIETQGSDIIFNTHQTPRARTLSIEPDMSSCFAIAAAAVMQGNLTIDPFPETSWQPDARFIPLLQEMGVSCEVSQGKCRVVAAPELRPLDADLNDTPDLFPVLAVLLARASGSSRLTGLQHLVHKESDRLKNTKDLLARLGRVCKGNGKEIIIEGRPEAFTATGDFDPDQDHRMAMAAEVANQGGARFNILHKSVVDKSFPKFWKIVSGHA